LPVQKYRNFNPANVKVMDFQAKIWVVCAEDNSLIIQ